MMQVNEIMTTDVISVKRHTPIHKAIELVIKKGISGLPVVDDDMNLIGILSERDMLKLYNDTEAIEKKSVNDFMTQPAIHFEETESVSVVTEFFVKNIFRKIPITSNGKLVGMTSIVDVLNYIFETCGESGKETMQTHSLN